MFATAVVLNIWDGNIWCHDGACCTSQVKDVSVSSLLKSKYLVQMQVQNKILPACWITMTEFPFHYYSAGADDKNKCY
jgi:hypothetical protein